MGYSVWCEIGYGIWWELGYSIWCEHVRLNLQSNLYFSLVQMFNLKLKVLTKGET